MRLPEDEHCDTAKAVDQLGRAPATASGRYVSGQAFWVLRGGYTGSSTGFLLSGFVSLVGYAFGFLLSRLGLALGFLDLHWVLCVVLDGFWLSWYVD